MDKPELNDIEIEHPSSWDVAPIVIDNIAETISQESKVDIYGRKYSFTLKWAAIEKSNYEDIEDIINGCIDDETDLWFKYQKLREAVSKTKVTGRLSAKDFVGGSGATSYYVGVTLVLKEVESRS